MVQKFILHLSLKFSEELIKRKKRGQQQLEESPNNPSEGEGLTSFLCRLVAPRTASRATASASLGLPVSSSSPEVSPAGLSVGASSGAPAVRRSTAASSRGESRPVRRGGGMNE